MKRLTALLPAAFLLLQGFATVPVTANDMGNRDDARLAGRSENGTDHAVYRTSSDAAPVIQAAYAGPDTASPTGHVPMVQPITVAMTDTPSRLSRRRDRRATPGGRREALLTPSRSIAVPAGEQYLYGSGEAAAASIQTYNALETYLLGIAADRAIGRNVRSVVLAPGATLQNPAVLPCDQKPMAVVFDIDETVVFNLGFEQASLAAGGGYSAERWDAWEKSGSRAVSLVPGVQDAIKVARDAHVEVIFNSNRSGANAAETAAMLNGLGVGPVAYGKNLWLKGDGGSTGNGKDTRRQDISVHHCVIAMVGDQLGDFSDLFNASDLTIAARRQLPAGREIRLLWGHGWFMLPNPVYGTALNGTQADVFPADKRWTPGSAPLPDPATTESK